MAELNKGQSLIELVIAVGVGAIIILAAVAAVSVTLRIASQDPTWQRANFLGQQFLDNIIVTAEGNWFIIANATNTSHLVINSVSGGFDVEPGATTTIIDDISYSRSFFTTSTLRNASGQIVDSGGIPDPSTKKVEVRIGWSYRGQPAEIILQSYLGRTANEVFLQTNWVGGPTCPTIDPVVTSGVHTQFCTSTPAVDYNSEPGSVKIKGY